LLESGTEFEPTAISANRQNRWQSIAIEKHNPVSGIVSENRK
jgi:hypothetical protein